MAQRLIDSGDVQVDGVAVPKAASQVTATQVIRVVSGAPRYASRGALKLAGALDDFGLDPTGRVALDAGAAHGGFSDVLLRRGAAHVIAVDVAYGQFAWSLRNDERVTLYERTNVRGITPKVIGGATPGLIVADLSFISLTKVLPALVAVAHPDVTVLPMVKPQFEVGRELIGKNGVVRDPASWASAMAGVAEAAEGLGLELLDTTPSRAPGPAGNIEFFLRLARGNDTGTSDAPAANSRDDIIQRGIARAAELQ